MRNAFEPMLASLLALGLVACAGGGRQPEIATGGRAEVTVDGLHRLDYSGFRDAWVKPDADFASYSKILVAPPRVSYRREPRQGRYRGPESNFALSAEQMAAFAALLRSTFEEELARSEHYELVGEPGADVLRMEPAVIDLTVKVPTEPRTMGRDFVFTTSTADMTLLMELRDAQSGEILARVADRREARTAGHGPSDLYWSNSVTDRDAVRRVFRRWARILRQRLDAVHEIEPDRGRGGA